MKGAADIPVRLGRDAHGRTVKVATCGCGAEHAIVDARTSGLPPSTVAKKFQQAGWSLDRRHAYCSNCQKGKARMSTARTKSNGVAAQPSRVVRDPTPAEYRKIINALEEHFDEARGAYRGGRSDQRIGEDLEIPWAVVAKVRDEAFGPLKVNPEILAAQNDVQELGERLGTIQKNVLDTLSRYETDLAEVKARLAKLGGDA